jgi:hypothetical protein
MKYPELSEGDRENLSKIVYEQYRINSGYNSL